MTTDELRADLHKAARFLAGLDQDRAGERNNVGYSRYDSDFGHSLAEKDPETWTPKMVRGGRRMLYRYRGQLACGGINATAWPEVPETLGEAVAAVGGRVVSVTQEPSTSAPNVWLDKTSRHLQLAPRSPDAVSDGVIRIRFTYDPELVKAVKDQVPGRLWNPGLREWNASPTADAIRAAVAFGNASRLRVDPVLVTLAARFKDLPARRIERKKNFEGKDTFFIYHPWDNEIAEAARKLPGREWNGACWTIPVEAAAMAALAEFGKRYDFHMPDGLPEEAAEAIKTLDKAIAASSAQDGEIVIPNFGGPGDEPYPFQRGGIEYLLDKKRAICADEMGLGKTIQALGAVASTKAFPAIVVCPATLKENWRREIMRWLPGRSVVTLKGRKPYDLKLFNAHVYILNYDILKAWVETLMAEAPRALILDESHMAKNGRSQRTKACKALAKSKSLELVLLLTGTPVMNRPMELLSQLQILGRLGEFGGWKGFTSRFCSGYMGRYGYDTSGSGHLLELNTLLRKTCMVRRLKADVLTELPPKIRTRVILPLTNRAEYERTEADVIRWIGEQAELNIEKRAEFRERAINEWDEDRCRAIIESAPGLLRANPNRSADRSDLERQGVSLKSYVTARARQLLSAYRAEKETRAAQAEQLVRIEALKQVAVAGKMKAALRWIGDFLETGEQLIVFATHVNVVTGVAAHFREVSREIYGATSMPARTAAVDDFQSGKAQLIVGNLQAMGVGLTLTAASNVAFMELGWNPAVHDQCEDRAHRIGQDSDSVTAHYLLSEDTIDEEIERLIAEKREVVDAATDGKEAAKTAKTSVLADLVQTLREKGA